MAAQPHIKQPSPMVFEGFEELEAAVAPILARKKEADAARKAKDRIIQGTADAAQLAEDAARVRKWEAEHEYRSAGLVAMFEEQECSGCGDCQYFLIGLFTRDEHVSRKGERRWEPVTPDTDLTLPREVMYRYRQVGFCGECLEREGFSWNRLYRDGEDPEEQLRQCDLAKKGGEPARLGEIFPGVAETAWPFPNE